MVARTSGVRKVGVTQKCIFQLTVFSLQLGEAQPPLLDALLDLQRCSRSQRVIITHKSSLLSISPVNVVTHSRNQPGEVCQVFPIWITHLVINDANYKLGVQTFRFFCHSLPSLSPQHSCKCAGHPERRRLNRQVIQTKTNQKVKQEKAYLHTNSANWKQGCSVLLLPAFLSENHSLLLSCYCLSISKGFERCQA